MTETPLSPSATKHHTTKHDTVYHPEEYGLWYKQPGSTWWQTVKSLPSPRIEKHLLRRKS